MTDPRAPMNVQEANLLMAPLQGVIERVVPKTTPGEKWGEIGRNGWVVVSLKMENIGEEGLG